MLNAARRPQRQSLDEIGCSWLICSESPGCFTVLEHFFELSEQSHGRHLLVEQPLRVGAEEAEVGQLGLLGGVQRQPTLLVRGRAGLRAVLMVRVAIREVCGRGSIRRSLLGLV